MSLCTQDDLELRISVERLRQLAFVSGSTDPDAGVIAAAIEWATEEVYAPILQLYAAEIPFTSETCPVVLRNIAVTFAVYWLATRHREYSEIYVQNYRDARKQLEAIAKGDIALFSPDGRELLNAEPQMAVSGVARSTTLNQTPIFSRSVLEAEMRRRY